MLALAAKIDAIPDGAMGANKPSSWGAKAAGSRMEIKIDNTDPGCAWISFLTFLLIQTFAIKLIAYGPQIILCTLSTINRPVSLISFGRNLRCAKEGR